VPVKEDDVHKAFSKLQNGSDIRGVAISSETATQIIDAVGGAWHTSTRACNVMLTACHSAVPENPVTLQPASAAYIARGFVEWLAERTGKPADQLRVSVSR
jgi:hypothetical protein